jgi:hypothetical protein
LFDCWLLYGPAFAELTGALLFDDDITLTVWEDLDFAEKSSTATVLTFTQPNLPFLINEIEQCCYFTRR